MSRKNSGPTPRYSAGSRSFAFETDAAGRHLFIWAWRSFLSLYSVAFFLIAAEILLATLLAITRRNLVRAVIYLIFSFLGTALLFYLLGAPFLALLHVIIYSGAIMIVCLFVTIRTTRKGALREHLFAPSQLLPAAILGLGYLAVGALLVFRSEGDGPVLPLAAVDPREFGAYIFQTHWLSVEIASLLLLVGLIGALLLGGKPAEGGGAEG
jgi:NADH-quinone oxidoreductase subunit J